MNGGDETRAADRPNKLRCVFDCVVLLQAAVSRRGPAFALLELVENSRIELLISEEVMAELRDVLVRPSMRQRFPTLTAEIADGFVQRVREIATSIHPVPKIFRYARDPDDEPYINLALAGSAAYLVTRDRDLLDLATSTSHEALALRRIHPELKILDPVAMLRQLKIST